MSVIRTDAGRRLLTALGGTDDDDYRSPTAHLIAAVEEEATCPFRDVLEGWTADDDADCTCSGCLLLAAWEPVE